MYSKLYIFNSWVESQDPDIQEQIRGSDIPLDDWINILISDGIIDPNCIEPDPVQHPTPDLTPRKVTSSLDGNGVSYEVKHLTPRKKNKFYRADLNNYSEYQKRCLEYLFSLTSTEIKHLEEDLGRTITGKNIDTLLYQDFLDLGYILPVPKGSSNPTLAPKNKVRTSEVHKIKYKITLEGDKKANIFLKPRSPLQRAFSEKSLDQLASYGFKVTNIPNRVKRNGEVTHFTHGEDEYGRVDTTKKVQHVRSFSPKKTKTKISWGTKTPKGRVGHGDPILCNASRTYTLEKRDGLPAMKYDLFLHPNNSQIVMRVNGVIVGSIAEIQLDSEYRPVLVPIKDLKDRQYARIFQTAWKYLGLDTPPDDRSAKQVELLKKVRPISDIQVVKVKETHLEDLKKENREIRKKYSSKVDLKKIRLR